MARVLGQDLNLTEKVILANMTLHEGWQILKKLMTDACVQATQDMVKLDPINDSGYDRKLKLLQARARLMNEFCSSVLASAEWHVNEGMTEENERKEQGEYVQSR